MRRLVRGGRRSRIGVGVAGPVRISNWQGAPRRGHTRGSFAGGHPACVHVPGGGVQAPESQGATGGGAERVEGAPSPSPLHSRSQHPCKDDHGDREVFELRPQKTSTPRKPPSPRKLRHKPGIQHLQHTITQPLRRRWRTRRPIDEEEGEDDTHKGRSSTPLRRPARGSTNSCDPEIHEEQNLPPHRRCHQRRKEPNLGRRCHQRPGGQSNRQIRRSARGTRCPHVGTASTGKGKEERRSYFS